MADQRFVRCSNPRVAQEHHSRIPVATSGLGKDLAMPLYFKSRFVPSNSRICNKVAYIVELIKLEDDLRLNIPEIDSQHEELIELVNGLHLALVGGADKAARDGFLSKLLERTRSHCAYEEELMLLYGYPGYQAHKSDHDRLTKKVADLIERYQCGELLLSVAVVMELKGWATTHIEKSDKPLGLFLRDRNGVDMARE